MELTVQTSLAAVGAEGWRPFEAPDYPFADYEFLAALASSGSVGEGTGWQPAHLVLSGDDGRPLAVALTYAKSHSYGEYVFDWEWARFYRRHGAEYYPKLVAAVPFTPAVGPRLLVRRDVAPDAATEARALLVRGALALAGQSRLSSVHGLFLTPEDAAPFAAAGFTLRHGCQYHWRNRGYRDFADYLDAFVGKRRRDVLRERRRAQSHGLEIRCLTGDELTPAHAAGMEQLYLSTADRKNAMAYLQPRFFAQVFAAMPERVLLTAAFRGPQMVAAALNFHKGQALYGRYWGALDDFPDLHFELCYYQTLDFALAQGIQLFEAGAQGEHKIQRGFLPSVTLSAHRLLDPSLAPPIEAFMAAERAAMDEQMRALAGRSPFRQPGQPESTS